MFGYSPKLLHAAFTAFVCIAFIAMCGYTKNEQVIKAFTIGAWIFAIITAIVLGTIVLDSLNQRVAVMTEFIREFGKLDDEARAAVAFEFPSMRYVMRAGKVREMFEDTNVPMDTFIAFLQTSSERYTSAERDWNTKEKPRPAWLEIMAWLQSHGYVIEDSYAGNHSWMWRGNAYKHLTAYWLKGRKLQNLNTGTEATQTEVVA